MQTKIPLTPALATNLPLHLVGKRSTRVPHFWLERWGRGGTRPYQVQGFKARILLGILSRSEGERENRFPPCGEIGRGEIARGSKTSGGRLLFPLPWGEGQGEGFVRWLAARALVFHCAFFLNASAAEYRVSTAAEITA